MISPINCYSEKYYLGGIYIIKKRIEWLDIAKGIAIILVVFGHSPLTNGMRIMIYSFHIPLFFFLSGFVFNHQKYNNYKDFFKSKIKTLVIPYFLFSFIEYFIYRIWQVGVTSENYSTSTIFKGIFYASGTTLKLDAVLWFLPCLFVVQTIFFLITKITVKHIYLILTLIVFSIAGYYYKQHFLIRLPWFIDSALTAIVFYGMGFIYKTYDSLIDKKLSSHFTEIILGSFALLYVFSIKNNIVDLSGVTFNNYFYYYASAICGIICCLALSKLIKHSNTLTFLGKNTVLIFVFHTNMFVVVNVIIGHIRTAYSLDFNVQHLPKWALLYTSLSILMIIPIIIIVNVTMGMIKNRKFSITQQKTLKN